jgi:hypothetical protein
MKKGIAFRTAKFVSNLSFREEQIKSREQELMSIKTQIVEQKIKDTQRLTKYKQALMDLLEDREDARKRALFLIEEEI